MKKELHNLFVAHWQTPKTPESMHSSGTSGPIASRDDGATPAKPTKDLTHGTILSQHQVRRDGQTVRVCVPKTLPWYRFVARQTRFARENMVTPAPTPRHARTHMSTPARARAPTHARTPEDDHDRFMLGFLKGLLFQLCKIYKLFLTFKNKGTTKKPHDTTNTCSCDCGVRATVPSETTVSRESKHDSKQL